MSDSPISEHSDQCIPETTSLDAINILVEAGPSEPPQPISPEDLARLMELKRLLEERDRGNTENT